MTILHLNNKSNSTSSEAIHEPQINKSIFHALNDLKTKNHIHTAITQWTSIARGPKYNHMQQNLLVALRKS